ncbi:type II toxin-antitoxin system RelE/ParE family toxin [Pantoea cypripedii]|uniref:type II toxin-antitoxin system RelE family toxin n=1 Tax=Pantoea cypripedii TaxID=55209 RepID=UPI002FC918B3
MSYIVKFRQDALKEWQKLDKTIQQQFAKKLKKCSENPHIPAAKLRGIKDSYKIKLRASGFRLVYQVIDMQLVIAVVAVGKRERSDVYNLASERMRS